MNHKHAIVVDANGYKVEFVLVHIVEVDGAEAQQVYAYQMKPGESLVHDDIPTALAMLKPRWQNNTWQETATKEEIAKAKESHHGL